MTWLGACASSENNIKTFLDSTAPFTGSETAPGAAINTASKMACPSDLINERFVSLSRETTSER
jgi:hypothetical protein